MKAIALEFTLTRATILKMMGYAPTDAPLERGHDEIRFRVVVGDRCYYRKQNVLGEDEWVSVSDSDGPCMGTAHAYIRFDFRTVTALALRHMATEYLPGKAPAQEHPNGSAVLFDLGTV